MTRSKFDASSFETPLYAGIFSGKLPQNSRSQTQQGRRIIALIRALEESDWLIEVAVWGGNRTLLLRDNRTDQLTALASLPNPEYDLPRIGIF
jgi:hypothetical protein